MGLAMMVEGALIESKESKGFIRTRRTAEGRGEMGQRLFYNANMRGGSNRRSEEGG
jgi:hypothetical protein